MKKNCLILFLFFSLAAFSQTNNDLPIGVFDSGTGGLTVMEAILTLDAFNNNTGKPGSDGKPDFEKEYFQYLADQANMPYGNYAAVGKTDLLREHILKNLQFVLQTNYALHSADSFVMAKKPAVKMMVVACNTATAYALSDMQTYLAQYNATVPCIGVIDAGAKAALHYQQSHQGTVGVFATAGTVASNGYPNTLQRLSPTFGISNLSIISQGGVGLAESIDRDLDFISDAASQPRANYRGPSFKNKNLFIDTALLSIYHFDTAANKLLCEYDATSNRCLDMQLNDPENYVRYHLVTLLEKMLQQPSITPMNTLILGCTHYPYLKTVIAAVLQELYHMKYKDSYRYRSVLASHVELVDPAVETAKEAYLALRENKLQQENQSNKKANLFFICIPNTTLKEIELQTDGWFTYQYKYGRKAGEQKKYVQYVPFDKKNISSATYQRIAKALPHAYLLIEGSGND